MDKQQISNATKTSEIGFTLECHHSPDLLEEYYFYMEPQNYNLEYDRQAGLRERGVDILYEGNIVALQHDPAHRFAVLALRIEFLGVVQHQVHVLIESDNVTCKSESCMTWFKD